MSNPLPNLNVNIGDVDTSRPFIVDRTQVPATIDNMDVVDSKSSDGKNLVVYFKTSEPAPSTKEGQVINAGYTLRKYYPLQASPKQIEAGREDGWREDIASLVDCALGTDNDSRPSELTQELLQELFAKKVLLTVRLEESDQYGMSNSISRVSAIG